jgi:hypothetical protein
LFRELTKPGEPISHIGLEVELLAQVACDNSFIELRPNGGKCNVRWVRR